MTLARQTVNANVLPSGEQVASVLLTEEDVKMMAENPQQVMEDIEARATVVSSVLANILLEPQGHSDWGINE